MDDIARRAELTELLAVMAEEGAEVTQACTKAIRFGIDDLWPERGITNAEQIALEIGDFLALVDRIVAHPDSHVTSLAIAHARAAKHEKLKTWLRCSPQKEKN